MGATHIRRSWIGCVGVGPTGAARRRPSPSIPAPRGSGSRGLLYTGSSAEYWSLESGYWVLTVWDTPAAEAELPSDHQFKPKAKKEPQQRRGRSETAPCR